MKTQIIDKQAKLEEHLSVIDFKCHIRHYVGKIKIMNKDTKQMYDHVIHYLQENDYSFEILQNNKILVKFI